MYVGIDNVTYMHWQKVEFFLILKNIPWLDKKKKNLT